MNLHQKLRMEPHYYAGRRFTLSSTVKYSFTEKCNSYRTTTFIIHEREMQTRWPKIKETYRYTYRCGKTWKCYQFWSSLHGKIFTSNSIHTLMKTLVQYDEKVVLLNSSFSPNREDDVFYTGSKHIDIFTKAGSSRRVKNMFNVPWSNSDD